MSYGKHEGKVIQWGYDRGIVQHGKPHDVEVTSL